MKTEIKLDKHIPAPALGDKSKHPYPLVKMEVGDSFAVPVAESTRVRAAINYHKSKHPDFRYKGQTRTENDIRVVRFWRV